MKKYILGLAVGLVGLTSCDMNDAPKGTISDETAIENVADAMKFRNGLYYQLRAFMTGYTVFDPEIQADHFLGTAMNGNRSGESNLGNINPGYNAGFWSNPYAYIANCNFFIEKMDAMIEGGDYTGESLSRLKRYRGEAFWARAYHYYFLMDHFCNSFSCINPTQAASGVPIVTEYHPTADSAVYPGRNTLSETASQINSDLDKAYADLKAFETSGAPDATGAVAPNAAYLSSYAVLALQARIALLQEDWQTAITKAQEVIAGPYSLTEKDDYPSMWINDEGSELIFLPYGNQAQSGGINSTGTRWVGAGGVDADYVLTENALALYDADNDIRYEAFVATWELAGSGVTVPGPVFIKYPGNPALNTGSTNARLNLPKPLRLSEMYLIVAEAAAESNNTVVANKALNELREVRLYNYTATDYTGSELVDQVRLEREKELIGEGYRISDLRRWKQGFSRSTAYPEEYMGVIDILVSAGMMVSYQPGDYRMVLPIPTTELDANPQLKGQQNPGY